MVVIAGVGLPNVKLEDVIGFVKVWVSVGFGMEVKLRLVVTTGDSCFGGVEVNEGVD